MDFKKLGETAAENAGFLAVVLATAAIIIAAAAVGERVIAGKREKHSPARKAAVVGMLSAMAMILQIFEWPLLFIAPEFYKLDFSEVPVLICAFSMGPTAGVVAELLKNLLKILLRGTSTAFVGDFANFAVGCSFIVPAALVYFKHKTKKMAIIGCITGTVVITVFGSLFNAVYLLPAFAKLYGMELPVIIEMGHKIYPFVENFNIMTFAAMCVAPINLIKGAAVSVVVMLIYKPINRVIRQIQN